MNKLTTVINRDYAVRFLGVALLFIGLAGWFLYDGFVGYPSENEKVAPLTATLAQRPLTPTDWMNTAKTGTAPLVEAFQATGLTAPSKYSDTFNSWIRAGDARANDVEMARAILTQPVHSAEDIRAQFVSAGIGLLAALALLGLLAVRLLTQFELDDEALHVSFGKQTRRYPLADVKRLDVHQWEKRGILKVEFQQGVVVLDAWHHQGIREIVAKLQEKCTAIA